jgi:hypothetical protein
MKSDLGYPPEMEPAIQEELTVLASIEMRYHDELARLECSASSTSVKDHLRRQLAFKRNSAREPHVLSARPRMNRRRRARLRRPARSPCCGPLAPAASAGR